MAEQLRGTSETWLIKYSAVGPLKTPAGLTGLPAGLTVSTVTRLLAAVEATVELVAADQVALVLHILDGQTETSDTTSYRLALSQ